MKQTVVASIGAAVTLVNVTAAADPAFTVNKPQVGIDLGYGIYTGETQGEDTLNPYGLGFGVRGGYTLDFGLYVGGAFHYYLGYTEKGSDPLLGTFESSGNVSQFGVELGYDLGLGPEFVLRPKVGRVRDGNRLSEHGRHKGERQRGRICVHSRAARAL